MRTLIYVKVNEQSKAAEMLPALRTAKDTASIRVTEFWKGETERCEAVVTDNEDVAKAYKAVGIEVKPFTKSKVVERKVEEVKPVEVVKEPEVTEEPARRGRPKTKDVE